MMSKGISVTGSKLINELGTFFKKYYPHKDFILKLLSGIELDEIQKQVRLQEIANKLSFVDCPLVKKENFVYLTFNTKDLFL